MTLSATLPSPRDEAWRYADHEAVARAWPALAEPERIVVAAAERAARVVDAVPDHGIVRLHVDIARGGRFDLHTLVAGHDYARVELTALLSEGAHCEVGGAILASGTQRLEIVTDIRHLEPGATSQQTVRAVAGGRAQASFLGGIGVARGAQQTNAEQSFKAMLLDRGARANAVPSLEIYADDVKCGHGATVGELDRNALFYLAARGLPPATARRLMLQAFLAEAFEGAGDADTLAARADAALEAML